MIFDLINVPEGLINELPGLSKVPLISYLMLPRWSDAVSF